MTPENATLSIPSVSPDFLTETEISSYDESMIKVNLGSFRKFFILHF